MNIVTKGEFNLSRVNTICFKKKDFTLHFSLYFPPPFFFLRRKDSYDPSSCKMGGGEKGREDIERPKTLWSTIKYSSSLLLLNAMTNQERGLHENEGKRRGRGRRQREGKGEKKYK